MKFDAKLAGLVISPPHCLFDAGRGCGVISLRKVGDSQVVMNMAGGFRIGTSSECPLEVGDRIVVSVGVAQESATVQGGRGQRRIELERTAIVAHGLCGPSQGFVGDRPVAIALCLGGCQGDASAKGGDSLFELPQLVGAKPLVEVGPEVLWPFSESILKFYGCLLDQARAKIGSPKVIMLFGGPGRRIHFLGRERL